MRPLAYLLLAGSLSIGIFAFGQGPKTLYVEDIVRSATKQPRIVIDNATIKHLDSSNPGSGNKVGTIIFTNCQFPDFVSFNSLAADSIVFRNCSGGLLAFMDLEAGHLVFYDSQLESLDIATFHIQDTLYRSHVGNFSMISSSANRFAGLLAEINSSYINAGSIDLKRCKMGNMMARVGNNFEMADCASDVVRVAVPTENIELNFNQLSGGKLRVATTYQVYDPELGGVLEMSNFITTDSLTLNAPGTSQRFSSLDSAYFHSPLFDILVYNYQRLFNSYRTRGDVESANACYVELKELERSRLRFYHDENPSFKSFFRLQLSSLMKAYTEHGTDPAKAITVSVWVLLLFAVFYFFFPSDWDVTSKKRLLENYRDFIEKNEKGYVKPFLKLAPGFTLSFVNALTLSLNSFTTLGFGNIPTHGIARYVCVLQGFIGWFLLSIFTVALINQASF